LTLNGYTFVGNVPAVLSVISRIELPGWMNISPDAIARIETYISRAYLYPLNEPVILKSIDLRQHHKIKTPDAIIAATALVYDLTLLTRNLSDFKQIPGLKLLNPFDL
jgi:predicted nucleic acid-binding protein